MRILKKLFAMVLILSMVTMPVYAAKKDDVGTMVENTSKGLSLLANQKGSILRLGKEFPAGTSACDWTALALALSGSKEDYSAYLKDLKKFVEDAYVANGELDSVKSTTYHRIALTVMALGGNPKAFGTKPDGSSIDLIADGTYGFRGESLGLQGLNGWIYALLALDASQVTVPENARFTRDDMISAIVNSQEADGGFGLIPGNSDVDITAMALQALAPYQEEHSHIIDAALDYLSEQMTEKGMYCSYGAESAESSAQVLMTLCALGIDPYEDSRFIKGHENIMTGLARYKKDDSTYGHQVSDETGDFLATAQVLMSMLALDRMQQGKGWIFDFSDYALADNQGTGNMGLNVCAVCVVVLMSGVIIAGKRKKNEKKNG